MSTLEMVTVMNREDAKVARAIQRVLPEIAKAVDVIARCFARGGRLIYVGTRNQRENWCAGCVGVPSDIRYKSRDGSVSDCRRRKRTGARN